jgi:hypothetical protein
MSKPEPPDQEDTFAFIAMVADSPELSPSQKFLVTVAVSAGYVIDKTYGPEVSAADALDVEVLRYNGLSSYVHSLQDFFSEKDTELTQRIATLEATVNQQAKPAPLPPSPQYEVNTKGPSEVQ